jgi:L-fucose mutarotase/ribose pyranase (RbsD/FucU family)
MSPLDNDAFGIAKGTMRGNEVPENDRIVPSLVFLKALDDIPAESIAAMWDRNFMLSHDEVSKEAAAEVLRPAGKNEKVREDFYAQARDAYRTDILGEEPLYCDKAPRELEDKLDGEYWK